METNRVLPEDALSKEWLTEDEVLDMLKMCSNTFKKAREKFEVPYAVFGAKRYYNSEDIHQMQLNSRRDSL